MAVAGIDDAGREWRNGDDHADRNSLVLSRSLAFVPVLMSNIKKEPKGVYGRIILGIDFTGVV